MKLVLKGLTFPKMGEVHWYLFLWNYRECGEEAGVNQSTDSWSCSGPSKAGAITLIVLRGLIHSAENTACTRTSRARTFLLFVLTWFDVSLYFIMKVLQLVFLEWSPIELPLLLLGVREEAGKGQGHWAIASCEPLVSPARTAHILLCQNFLVRLEK